MSDETMLISTFAVDKSMFHTLGKASFSPDIRSFSLSSRSILNLSEFSRMNFCTTSGRLSAPVPPDTYAIATSLRCRSSSSITGIAR